MTKQDRPEQHALQELRFALDQALAEEPTPQLRQDVLSSAFTDRAPGQSWYHADQLSGAETFGRAVDSLDGLLASLATGDWGRPTIRDLDVQGLVGHLIGVEMAFADALSGTRRLGAGTDHVSSTQSSALAQKGRLPSATHRDWRDLAEASLRLVAGSHRSEAPTSFYGITLPLDEMLVIRSFEMWIHSEDIRRSAGRDAEDPDPGRLTRMTRLAMTLLPVGITQAEQSRTGQRARLVLTGPGGGTWDIALDGTSEPGPEAQARVIVDAAQFCRVVGNRADLEGSSARVSGDTEVARAVFAGAAALALD